MNNISDEARKCAEEVRSIILEPIADGVELEVPAIIQRACIAYHEAKSKELVKLLDDIVAAWDRHGPRIIESRGGLEDNRVCEVNDAIEKANAVRKERE